MDKKSISKYLMVMGVVLLLVAVGNFAGGNTAWASNSNQGCVPGTIPCPTATPSPGGGGSGSDGSSGSNSAPTSHILGTVTDLSANQPGAGIAVQINGVHVTTDSAGKYSLSNVAAGTYTVSPVLTGDAVSAQEPVTVQVDGVKDVTVDLGYYSAPVSVTPTPGITETMATTATTELPAPQTLPETGGSNGGTWFAVAGMLLIFGGMVMQRKSVFR